MYNIWKLNTFYLTEPLSLFYQIVSDYEIEIYLREVIVINDKSVKLNGVELANITRTGHKKGDIYDYLVCDIEKKREKK